MKVFDLHCDQSHPFEGWFASRADFDKQLASGQIRCPQCDSPQVQRIPAATRIIVGDKAPPPQALVAGQPQWMDALRSLVAATEDVGERFAEEARRIHYSESPPRAIRGVASADERRELEDEGIDVVALPFVASRKEPLQ